jgi:hypothetical protein
MAGSKVNPADPWSEDASYISPETCHLNTGRELRKLEG